MYFGLHQTVIDDKGRITVPRRFRDIMEREDHITWQITMGFNGNLYLYNRPEWERLLKHTDGLPYMDPEIHDFLRCLYGLSTDSRVDGQGRLPIPVHLREMMELGREVVLVGMRDHLELWSKESWEKFCVETAPKYRSMAAERFVRAEQPDNAKEKGEPSDEH